MSSEGTCTTLSIFIREQSMNAMLCLSRLNIYTLSFGIYCLSNMIDPDPTNL